MNSNDDIRQSVSRAYARAATKPVDPRGATGCGCGSGSSASATAALAGYAGEALKAIPEDAVSHSFGCGDPLAFSEVGPGDVVVDLGCGAGIDILLAARRVGAEGRVIGIDMTDEMLEKARRNIADSGLQNVEVRKGVIEELPVESQSVDWVISNCVINLSPEKDRVFAEIVRVLKPGGRMLVSDIVVEELPDFIRSNEALYHGCIGGAISESGYVAGLRRAGLAEVEVRKRFVYEAGQLEYLLGEGLHGADGGTCCGLEPTGSIDANSVAESLAGKIWSAQFYGKK